MPFSRERKMSPKFSCIKFSENPRVMDVRAFGSRTSRQKNFIVLCSERWGESFWAGVAI